MTLLQLPLIWLYSALFGLYDFENGKRCRHMNFHFQLILKSPKNMKILIFLPLAFDWPSKNILAFFQFS